MARYIQQLRRGKKETDSMGTITRDDWAEYEAKADHQKPLEGELVLEYDNGVPRLKIGDGVREFSQLPYMSVDSFVLPSPSSVTLYADKWIPVRNGAGEAVVDTYAQVVTVANAMIAPNSKVDLQPNADQLCDFYDLGVALTTENEDGIVTVYVIGGQPSKSYTIQATVTEVVLHPEVAADE